MLVGHFNRSTGYATATGISVHRPPSQDHVGPLCRALVAAGIPDQPMLPHDQRGVPCLQLGSIHKSAKWDRTPDAAYRRHRPGEMEALRASGRSSQGDQEADQATPHYPTPSEAAGDQTAHDI